MGAFLNGASYRRQYLKFNGKDSRDFYLYLSGPGVYDSPIPDVEGSAVPGINGDIITENAKPGARRFQNVDIRYEAFFWNALPAKTAAVKAWLLSPVGYQTLMDTYDPDFFRMAACTSAVSFDVTRQKAAKMDLTFHCKPQRWLVDGQRKKTVENGGAIKNPFPFPSQPLIRVYGAGTVTVGDTEIEILSSDGYTDLDCETHNAYNASGFCNDRIFCEGDFPQLPEGETKVSWTGGITSVEVTPRWWTL